MSGVFGESLKISIFGESHGVAIGITLNGVPSGIKIDEKFIAFEMERRRAKNFKISTKRSEEDKIEIISGVFNGYTTGTPLTAVIKNNNMNPKDYSHMKGIMRPSHADYTGHIKYNGFNDYRGGGHFSGRITAPIVFAGAIAKLILRNNNIKIGAHILKIGKHRDESFNYIDIKEDKLQEIYNKEFPTIDDNVGKEMIESIIRAREEEKSLGGIIEGCAINMPVGIGEPFFDSFESILSHLLFSIPAVKGVEFGRGFDFAEDFHGNINDELYMEGNKVKTFTNNNGGIVGGITNGMPIVFKVAIKPTPSISKKQRTVDILDGKDREIQVKGRHDPCIVHRAVPVVEGMLAIAIVEMMGRN